MRRFTFVCAVLSTVAWQAGAAEVTITVDEPSGVDRTGWPVTSGIPLAEGALTDHEASALFTSDGTEVPLQTEVLARWPDGSVRWLLLDFQVDLAPSQKKAFALRFRPDVTRSPIADPVRVLPERGGRDGLLIDADPLRVSLSSPAADYGRRIAFDVNGDGQFDDDEHITLQPEEWVTLIDDQGERFTCDFRQAPVRKIVVEQSGPLRACVRIEGHHLGKFGQMFRYIFRIHAYRGQPFLRCFYTFVNDDQAAVMAQVNAIALHIPGLGAYPADTLKRYGSPPTEDCYTILMGRRASAVRARSLLQVDEREHEVDRKRVRGHAPGWAAAGNERCGVAVGLREFWQNWPKSLSVGPHGIDVGILPHFHKGLYDGKPLEEENKLYYQLRGGLHTFKVGVAKTHELWATFFAGQPDVEKLSDFFQAAEHPLLATCEPAYVSSTKAAGEFPPADPKKYAGYDAWLDRALNAHLKRRDKVREYGMLNYGDWYGERSVNWGNLEYDLAHGLFLQYLRTGDRRFYLRAEQAARHHIDVDVVHATNPHLKNPWGSPPRVGDIWLHCLNHTGGYYEDAPLPVSRTYQMGHSTNFGHVWVSGDLDYYYLTGDRRALEVSLEIADAMASHMPTSYGTHIRALGWPMILVLAAYEATGDKKYLEAATKNWEVLKKNIDWERGWVVRLAGDHCLHPPGSTREERETKYRDQRCQGNVPFMEGLTLCGLARYHRVTGDPEVLRAITVGIDQMIRECWQEDVKTFRYTACPLSSKTPYCLFMLSTEAMAYEVAQTGNQEHLRILREGVRAAIPKGDDHNFGKNLAQMIFFTPHGLAALEE